MKSRQPQLAVVLALAFALAPLRLVPLRAEQPPAVRILNASVDLPSGLLTAIGSDFGAVAPTVFLSGFALTLSSFGPTHIVAVLPAPVAANAGSYLLTITRFDKGNQTSTASFVVVVGANGASGPTGAQGPTGPQGAAGNDGGQGAIGPTGPQGVPGNTGAIGPTGLPGAPGIGGLIGPTGPQGPQGVGGLEVVSETTLYPSVGAFATSLPASAGCPIGKKVTGGGFELAIGTNLVLTASMPLGTTGWRVNFLNPGTALGTTAIKVHAMCVSSSP